MISSLPGWLLPILGSAIALGFYDLCKKHAVRDNSIMPVLFMATFSGSLLYLLGLAVTGRFLTAAECTALMWNLIAIKAVMVSASWICVYYAMRELPISIASPIRASAPLWTFIGSLILYSEIPSVYQAVGMLVIFGGYYLFSILGKMEGISFRRHRGIHMIFLGTFLGAGCALYDKYLLGVLKISPQTVQFWFSVDLVFVLGAAYLVKISTLRNERSFKWRWSIPLTGIILILADWMYFYALSLPDAQISILSLLRRCNCIVTFSVGYFYFRDSNLKGKIIALALILSGVIILALASK